MAPEGQGNPKAMGVYTWDSVDTSANVKGDRTAGSPGHTSVCMPAVQVFWGRLGASMRGQDEGGIGKWQFRGRTHRPGLLVW